MSTENESPEMLMLCPGCCTLDDIPEWKPTLEVLTPLVGCTRCPFQFPILPDDFRQLALDAVHHHECTGHFVGNWQALGQAIVDAIHQSAVTGADLAERLDGLWPSDAPVKLG